MTSQEALRELFARLGACNGAALLISEEEMSHWPTNAIKAMKSYQLLMKSSPASSIVCPGCEQACIMPVHTQPAGQHRAAAFIVCDKRDDINRVNVPIEKLVQWEASGIAIAVLLANLLELRHSDDRATTPGRWEVGVLKGRKGSSHLVLVADGKLRLNLAGHSLELADVLELVGDDFTLDKRTLSGLVDKPVGSAGDGESAVQRRERIMRRVQMEKNRGNKAFLKTVSEGEGISVSRLKQLLKPNNR